MLDTRVTAGSRDNFAGLGSRRTGDPLSLSLKLSPQRSGDITKSAPSPVMPCGLLSRSNRASDVPTWSESAVEKCGESIATRHTLPSTISPSSHLHRMKHPPALSLFHRQTPWQAAQPARSISQMTHVVRAIRGHTVFPHSTQSRLVPMNFSRASGFVTHGRFCQGGS